mgnify:CR=1 FL=1
MKEKLGAGAAAEAKPARKVKKNKKKKTPPPAEQGGKPFELEDLQAFHEEAVEAAQNLFRKVCMEVDESGGYFEKIAHETGRRFEKIRRDNDAACQTFCQQQLDKLAVREICRF